MVLVLGLAGSARAQAPVADLAVSMTAPPSVLSGQFFEPAIVVENAGPNAALVRVAIYSPRALIRGAISENLRCVGSPSGVECSSGDSLLPPGRYTIQMEMLAPSDTPELELTATAFCCASDPVSSNNRATRTINVSPAASRSDLLLVPIERTPSPVGEPADVSIPVHNAGPDAADGAHLTLTFDQWSAHPVPSPTNMSPEWSCQSSLSAALFCSTRSLPAGETRTLRLRFPAPSRPDRITIHGRIWGENLADPVQNNDSIFILHYVGTPAEFTRVLVPVVVPATSGAFDSRWISEFSVHNGSSEALTFFPTNFQCVICTCPSPPPFGFELSPGAWIQPSLFASSVTPGQFVYYDKSKEATTSMQLRIRDVSRALQTWGTELPIVHEEEFRAATINLLDVPFFPRFRQMLRIYGLDTSENQQVTVRVNTNTGAKFERVVDLVVPPSNNSVVPLGLPLRPAYAAVLLDDAFPEVRETRVRLEVAGSGSRRYWAFVSVTNNDTQHVTTITPQPLR